MPVEAVDPHAIFLESKIYLFFQRAQEGQSQSIHISDTAPHLGLLDEHC